MTSAEGNLRALAQAKGAVMVMAEDLRALFRLVDSYRAENENAYVRSREMFKEIDRLEARLAGVSFGG